MVWFVHWFVKITGWIPHLFAFRKKIYYEDKKVQGRRIKGKALIVSNHHTVWDYAFLMFVFIGRNLRCQVAELMYNKNVFLTGLLKGLGSIKVNRNARECAFMRKSIRLLDKNKVVVSFPESRIPKKGEDSLLPFKPSAVYIALTSGAPIVPVAVNGAYPFFAKKRGCVMIGKPINVKEWYQAELSEKENIEIINKRLRDKVIELKNELARRETAKQNEKEKEKKGE